MAVAILSQSAGWRDRSMREIATAIGGLEALAALAAARFRRSEHPVDPRPLQQPGGLRLQRGRRLDVLPGHGIDRRGARQIDGGLVIADDGEEIAVTDEFDRRLGGALDRLLIDGADAGAGRI